MAASTIMAIIMNRKFKENMKDFNEFSLKTETNGSFFSAIT
jgi:hypothetical protein